MFSSSRLKLSIIICYEKNDVFFKKNKSCEKFQNLSEEEKEKK